MHEFQLPRPRQLPWKLHVSFRPKQPVDLHAVTLCKDVHLYQRNEFGSEDIFSEWALNVMVEKEWRLPNTFNEAYDLFSELILIIYAMEN